MLIYIHGVSGSGKSTVGKYLSSKLANSIHIDQDTFYRKDKPKIALPFTENFEVIVDNWDSEEAIDFDLFRETILTSMNTHDYVIVTGFALREHCMNIKAVHSFSLIIDAPTDSVFQLVCESRAKAKEFTQLKKQKDERMVKYIVIPFYMETLKQIQTSTPICVYTDDQRVDLDTITNEILKHIYRQQKV